MWHTLVKYFYFSENVNHYRLFTRPMYSFHLSDSCPLYIIYSSCFWKRLTIILCVMSLSFVRGQESLFEELDIAIWPEYDKPGVLVFMEGTIRQDALPTTLEFRVPEEVGAVGALFSDDSDKVPFEVPVVQREDGKWAILGIPRGQQILRTGYYYDPFIFQVERAINYLLEFNKSLDDFNVQIQEPLAAENFWIEDSTTQMSKDTITGLNSYSLHLEGLAAGKQKLISFGYLNPSGQLSIEELQQPPQKLPKKLPKMMIVVRKTMNGMTGNLTVFELGAVVITKG